MKSRHIVLRNDTLSTRDIWRGASTLSAGPGSQGLSAESLDIDRSTIPFLTRDASVLAVAPAMPMRLVSPFDTDGVPVEAEQTVTWGVHAVAADTSPFTGQGIVVAVLDTGIDSGHPAFAGIQVIQKDFTGEGNGDRHGHGTHCAGTIFGRAVNGTRIGVAPGVDKVLIGKVLDQNGGGSSDGIVEAMLWAVEQGAHIISMSIGMDFGGYVTQLVESGMPVELATSRALEGYRTNTRLFDTLSDHIRARGMQAQPTVIIAAAGNESQRDVSPDFEVAVSPPAVAEGIVSVAALGDTAGGYSTAPFSNTGANVSGPGVSIISAALGGGLRKMSGTSMATPHVAGVAALWAQQLSERGAHNIFNLIGRLAGTASSEHLQEGFDPFDVGAGLVQSPQAM